MDAVAAVLSGAQSEEAAQAASAPVSRGNRSRQTSVSSWTRLHVADGIELHLDSGVHNPTADQIVAARQALAEIFADRTPQQETQNGD